MAADTNIPTAAGERESSAAPARRGIARWGARTYWCWPVLATVGLGLYQITQPVLWRDELTGWALASRSVSQLLATAHRINGAQLPYYLILHYWIAATGTSALSMRALSVLAMAGAAAFVTLAARELAGVRAGITSGLIFALVPSVSRFAQEVRFYAPMMLFAALATWLLALALNRKSRALWAGYALSMGAAGCMEIVVMSLLAGHAGWVALRWWRDRGRQPVWFVLAAIVSVALCVPVIFLGSRQATDQVAWVPKPSFWPQALGLFASNLFYSGPVAVAVGVLAVLAWKYQPRLAGYLTAATLLPLAAICVLSEVSKVSYFFPRYALFMVITLAICAGVAVASLGRVIPVAVAIAGVFLLCVHDQAVIRQPSAHNWAGYPANVIWNTLNYDQAAQVIARHARPGDTIAYPEGDYKDRSRQINLGIDYYFVRHLKPGEHEPSVTMISKTATQANHIYPVPCGHPDQCVGSQSRIWLVASNGAYTQDPWNQFTPAEKAALSRDYVTSYVWHVGDLAISVLDRK